MTDSAQDLINELDDLLDHPAPVAAATVDIPPTVAIVQRNADLGLERLDVLLDDPPAWVDHDGRIFGDQDVHLQCSTGVRYRELRGGGFPG